jgi:hypothetical protein
MATPHSQLESSIEPHHESWLDLSRQFLAWNMQMTDYARIKSQIFESWMSRRKVKQ